jgi:hypothetical protein
VCILMRGGWGLCGLEGQYAAEGGIFADMERGSAGGE